MAHELATNSKTGKAAIAWVRSEGTPWHGLGVGVEEAMTAEQALELSGQDYEVAKVQLYAPLPNGEPLAIPDRFATVRADTGDLLGLVTNKYSVVQNRECYGFLDALVQESGLRYHTAGALRGGRHIWMLAKLPSTTRVVKDDLLDQYLLMSNTHDATQGLRVLFTQIRVVCWNTLSYALARASRGVQQGWTFTHTGDMGKKLSEARQMLGIAASYFDTFGRDAASMAATAITEAQARAYFESLYPDPDAEDATGEKADRLERDRDRARAERARLLELFHTGTGMDMPGVKGTVWACYNSVTEHIDHDRPDRKGSRDRRSASQLESSLFYTGRWTKGKAFGLAMDMVAGRWTPDVPTTAPVAAPAPKKKAAPRKKAAAV